MKDTYHHGNLRNALIEAGIKIITENVEDALSLRKVAAACGVSHAAPYAHFADKESLLNAIKETVTNGLIDELKSAAHDPSVKSAEDAIMAMGEKYILFFRNHPDYFNFLFQKQQIKIHTDMSKEDPDDYEPFTHLKRYVKKFFEEKNMNLSDVEQEMFILQTWGIVQGLASVASMSGVEVSIPWEVIAKECIKGNR